MDNHYSPYKIILPRIFRFLCNIFKGQVSQETFSRAKYAFGSKVKGTHNEWSDFDVLVVVRDKTPELEAEVISIFVDKESEGILL